MLFLFFLLGASDLVPQSEMLPERCFSDSVFFDVATRGYNVDSVYSKLEIGDELHFLTDKDSFLIKKYFHTKMGSFEGLEGGQVTRFRWRLRPTFQ